MLKDESAYAWNNLDFANQTTLHPVGISVLAGALLAALLLPRRHAALPLVAVIAMLPSAQRVVIMTMDFSLIRLMLLGMLLRITVRGEWSGYRPRAADWLVLGWAGWSITAYGLLLRNPGAAVTRTGYMIDAMGAWMVARVLLRDFAAFSQLTRFCAWLALLSVGFFLVERMNGRNLFSAFGGVPEVTAVREGRLRCQGPFSHPILAGVFWATLLPLFLARCLAEQKQRWLVLAGGAAAVVIVITTASSTPAMAVLIGGAAMALYPVRAITPTIRLALLAAIPALHLMMENGVHHLLARIDIVGGSTGWHRYHLMDEAIRHFGEWAAIGTQSTAHWGWGLQDVTNQYVLEGVRGGFPALLLFCVWLVMIFIELSRAIRGHPAPGPQLVLWGTGAMMFTHCLTFLAVSYSGQMVSAFFLFTGMTFSMAHTAATASNRGARPVGIRSPPRTAQRGQWHADCSHRRP